MNTYRIPCNWTVAGTMEIQANSLGEAIELANEAPLPTDNDYIEGSFEINDQMIPYLNNEGSFEINDQMIPYLNKNLTEAEMKQHYGEVIRW